MPVRFTPPRCPKPALWPEPDRERWENSRHDGDIFAPKAVGAEWAPLTRARIEAGYARWLSWLSVTGYLDPQSSPGERVTPERVRQYLAALQAINAPNTVLCRIQELRLALAVIVPKSDWAWICRLESRLRRLAGAARGKRTGIVSSDELYRLGQELMAAAERPSADTPVMQAVRYRDGLMICFLAARPLRRHNFTAIEIGRHLVKQGEEYWIHFEAAETKTRAPIEDPFPAALVPFLERYLSVYRPLLARCHGYWKRANVAQPLMALWLSSHGTSMAEVAVSSRFKKLTQAGLGRPVTMHRFRDSAATSIAIQDPGHVRITKSILGHSTLRTSEKHYNHATSLQAVRRYQARILELRRAHARRPDRSHTQCSTDRE